MLKITGDQSIEQFPMSRIIERVGERGIPGHVLYMRIRIDGRQLVPEYKARRHRRVKRSRNRNDGRVEYRNHFRMLQSALLWRVTPHHLSSMCLLLGQSRWTKKPPLLKLGWMKIHLKPLQMPLVITKFPIERQAQARECTTSTVGCLSSRTMPTSTTSRIPMRK